MNRYIHDIYNYRVQIYIYTNELGAQRDAVILSVVDSGPPKHY